MGNCATETGATDYTLGEVGDENEIMERFREAGQGHVFNGYQDLNELEKQNLLEQCCSFDVNQTNQIFRDLIQKPQSMPVDDDAGSFDTVEDSRVRNKMEFTEMERATFEVAGKALIKEGKVAVVVLAGGSGSRLGFAGPKGKFNVGLPSGKSLFQILTERFLKAQMMAHDIDADTLEEGDGSETAKVPREVQACKMLVMTNYETHKEIVNYFKENSFFGGAEEQFIFFPQSMLPAFTLEGNIMMADKGKIKLAPNGNGAFFDSLGRNQKLQGLLRGLEYVQVIGVDNILNKVLDPIQVGYTAENDLTCSLKACSKRDAAEKVGVIGKKNGQYNIVEYSELPQELANAYGRDGKLKFNLGHILVFMIKADFLLRLVTDNSQSGNTLYHKAFKKIEHMDPETGATITPTSENGWKFELFMHSFLPKVGQGNLGVLIVDRDAEFSPVKNADDPSQMVADSPAMARLMYLNESMGWLKSVSGLKLDGYAQIEVSPLLSYAGENMNWLKHVHKGKGLQGPGGYIDHQGTYTKTTN